MKQVTLIEFISILIVLIILSGIGWCVYQINDLKYQALVVNKLAENENWRMEVTRLLNHNLKEKKLVTPSVPSLPEKK